MPGFGDFYNKKKKKLSKDEQEKKASKSASAYVIPQPEIIPKGKKDKFS